MRQIMDCEQLAAMLNACALREGEVVWDRYVKIKDTVFFLPLMFTSQMAKKLGRGSLLHGDPNSWVVDSLPQDEFRLYVREGECYNEVGAHYFSSQVTVSIKSIDEYVCIKPLHRSLWWNAEFVCPYCDTICRSMSHCKHLFSIGTVLTDIFYSDDINIMMSLLGNRFFMVNLVNADIPGLKVKLPRIHFDSEWFRFAYIYAKSQDAVDIACKLMKLSKEFFHHA